MFSSIDWKNERSLEKTVPGLLDNYKFRNKNVKNN